MSVCSKIRPTINKVLPGARRKSYTRLRRSCDCKPRTCTRLRHCNYTKRARLDSSSRDSIGYVDGSSLYTAYFVPNKLDPSGREWVVDHADGPYYIPDPPPTPSTIRVLPGFPVVTHQCGTLGAFRAVLGTCSCTKTLATVCGVPISNPIPGTQPCAKTQQCRLVPILPRLRYSGVQSALAGRLLRRTWVTTITVATGPCR